MDSSEKNGNGAYEALPLPQPVPLNVTPIKADPEPEAKVFRALMARRNLGCNGENIPVLTNHFKVTVNKLVDEYNDGCPVDGKGVGRKVLDRVHETYDSELAGKEFAYDGEKSMFTVGSLPRNKPKLIVVLD